MAGRIKAEVLVVGAGPVGLCASLMLAQRGLAVQVIDKDWRTGAHSYALALHGASLRLFQELGLLEPLLARAYPVTGIAWYEGAQRRAELRWPVATDGLPAVVVMPQDVLERLLEEALDRQGVRVLWNHTLSRAASEPDRVEVTIDRLVKESLGYAVAHTEWLVAGTTETTVPFLIGADGHRSQVRRALEIEYAAVGPAQHFAVFEFQSDADLGQEVRVVLSDRTTNAVWPLPDGCCRWSFELPEFAVPLAPRHKERAAIQIGTVQFPSLTEEHLRLLLAERAPWFRGSIDAIKWRMVVRFERRLAASFGRDRVWLAGDAGHMTAPVGMQSMNVGFREARDLVARIAAVLRDGAPIQTLQEYGRQRAAEWHQLLGLDGGLQATPATEAWIARERERLLPCLPASGDDLRTLAGMLGLESR